MGVRGSSLSPTFLSGGKAFWALMAAAGRVLGLGPKPQAAQMFRLPGCSAKLIPTKPQMQLCACFPVLPKPGRACSCTRGQLPSPEESERWEERATAVVSPFLSWDPALGSSQGSALEEQAEMEQGSPGLAAHTGFLFPTLSWAEPGRGGQAVMLGIPQETELVSEGSTGLKWVDGRVPVLLALGQLQCPQGPTSLL